MGLLFAEEGIPRLLDGRPWASWPETARNSVRNHIMSRSGRYFLSEFLISLMVLESGVCETFLFMIFAALAWPGFALSLAVWQHHEEVRPRSRALP